MFEIIMVYADNISNDTSTYEKVKSIGEVYVECDTWKEVSRNIVDILNQNDSFNYFIYVCDPIMRKILMR